MAGVHEPDTKDIFGNVVRAQTVEVRLPPLAALSNHFLQLGLHLSVGLGRVLVQLCQRVRGFLGLCPRNQSFFFLLVAQLRLLNQLFAELCQVLVNLFDLTDFLSLRLKQGFFELL